MKRTLLIIYCLTSMILFAGQSAADDNIVEIETNLGKITIELFPESAPVASANFLKYVNDHYYDGLIFHRVIKDFIVQGGGLEPGLKERANREPIINEAKGGKPNWRSTVAMARTSAKDSATSQFFINLSDNFSLDHKGEAPDEFGYTVFGRVLTGMDVADKIGQTPTSTINGMQDVPIKDIIIKKAWIETH